MAERKSGPVKPPVIDLKAREAGTEPSETPPTETATEASEAPVPETATQSPEPAEAGSAPVDPPAEEPATPAEEPEEPAVPPPPRRPPARLAMPWSAISIAAAGGAVLGAALTYILANWVALPRQAPAFDDPGPTIAALTERVEAIDTRLANVEDAARNTQVSLDATLVQLDAATAELRQSIADVSASIPAAQPPVDLGRIETQLQGLESRVAAIAAGASSADAAALAEDIAGIEESLGALTGRVGQLDDTLASARAELDEAKATLAAQSRTLAGADIAPAVKVPLVVSGLESAFLSGRPYAAELQSLTALLPDLTVPEAIMANAPAGLPRPDAIADRFNAVLPDILAGRTSETTGDWAQDALTWAKALLALRPAEEMEGTTPEAIVSRLEGAVARHDFIAAAALLAQLPAPMRQAAGDVGTDIAIRAQADTFVTELRTAALAPAAEPAN